MSDTVIFSNTRGFQVKQNQVNSFVQVHKPAVFLIAEHFQSMPYHLQISGYSLAGCFCRNSREQGGVAIFVRKDVEYKTRKDLDAFCIYKQFEASTVEIPSKNLVVTVVYRPNAGAIQLFYSVLEKVLKIFNQNPKRNYLMAGTFNLAKRDDLYITEGILNKNHFKFALSSVTHVNGTSVDDFIVNFPPSSKTVMRDGFSDHFCIRLEVPIQIENKDLIKRSVKDGIVNEKTLDLTHDTNSDRFNYSQNLIGPQLKHSSLLNSTLPLLRPIEIPIFPTIPAVNLRPVGFESILRNSNQIGNLREIKKEPVLSELTNVSARSQTEKLSVSNVNKTKQEPDQKKDQNPLESSAKSKSVPKENLDMEAMISRCLTSDDFMDKFVSKLSEKFTNKVVESLSESLKEAKEQIQRLEKKVLSLESHIIKLEDELTL